MIAQNARGLRITECLAEDVALLDRHAPSDAVPSFHAVRFSRQRAGLSTYLIAWEADPPVGSCEIRWDGPAAVGVQQTREDCPEINGLVVWPESMRGRGVGTALIRAAESLARERGRKRIGLGVENREFARGVPVCTPWVLSQRLIRRSLVIQRCGRDRAPSLGRLHLHDKGTARSQLSESAYRP